MRQSLLYLVFICNNEEVTRIGNVLPVHKTIELLLIILSFK